MNIDDKLKDISEARKKIDEQVKSFTENGGMEAANTAVKQLSDKFLSQIGEITAVADGLTDLAKKMSPMIEFMKSQQAKDAVKEFQKNNRKKK
jgi:hypothetical protein